MNDAFDAIRRAMKDRSANADDPSIEEMRAYHTKAKDIAVEINKAMGRLIREYTDDNRQRILMQIVAVQSLYHATAEAMVADPALKKAWERMNKWAQERGK